LFEHTDHFKSAYKYWNLQPPSCGLGVRLSSSVTTRR